MPLAYISLTVQFCVFSFFGSGQMMLSMLTDPSLSDVCLVVEGKDVPVHKAVLGKHLIVALMVLPTLGTNTSKCPQTDVLNASVVGDLKFS